MRNSNKAKSDLLEIWAVSTVKKKKKTRFFTVNQGKGGDVDEGNKRGKY